MLGGELERGLLRGCDLRAIYSAVTWIADENGLTDFASEYEHGKSPP